VEEIGSFCVNPDTHKKYAPVIVADERGAKNDIRFFLRQDPCKAGLMQQAEQGICKQTLCS
jgi:hypothetical protein